MLELFTQSTGSIIVLAVVCGLAPALLWLVLWLHEDAEHPEPRWLITLAFLAGVIAVPLVIPLQLFIESAFGGLSEDNLIQIMLGWAVAEEIIKVALCWAFILWRKQVDEPIDYVVYLLATALGFAAMENAYYLAAPLLDANLIDVALTSQSRFLGANLLHAIASALVGVAIALAVGQTAVFRVTAIIIGMTAAIALHAFFNLTLIFGRDGFGLIAFLVVWIAGVLLLFMLEKIKHLRSPLS